MSKCDYYSWLMDIIDGPWKYSRAITELWNMDFYSDIPMDDNRAADGEELRLFFEEYTGEICEKGGPCSVLEMMIGLARRIENEYMYEYDMGDRTADWFWEMFYNIGLGPYDDFNFDQNAVKMAIFDFLNRAISMFPVKFPRKNWPEIEIWWQMNDYISEKFNEK